MTLARPLSTDSMPSVVIKALTPTTVTRKPLTAPARLPTAKATTIARGIEWPSATVAMATPLKAMIDATERSNWPAMISSVPGIATIPVTAMAVRTLRKLARVRNAGARIENVTISAIRTTTSAVILGVARLHPRDGAPVGWVPDGSASELGAAGWFRAVRADLPPQRRSRWR